MPKASAPGSPYSVTRVAMIVALTGAHSPDETPPGVVTLIESDVRTSAWMRSGSTNAPRTRSLPDSIPEYPCRWAEPCTGPENLNVREAESM